MGTGDKKFWIYYTVMDQNTFQQGSNFPKCFMLHVLNIVIIIIIISFVFIIIIITIYNYYYNYFFKSLFPLVVTLCDLSDANTTVLICYEERTTGNKPLLEKKFHEVQIFSSY